ncbi:MAG: aminotransferase class III-fold pyridoxal phosphate-dependent enzyme [Chloroflexi bacterium]|nr:aminotransferase class III-fold pyridoxal phosphate-dependent enzyme [Chloroflexota bacterium]
MSAASMNTVDLLARRRRRLGADLSLSYRAPLTIVRGSGAHLYDADGRAYLDLVNNVAHVGHAHPRVVEAAARQKALLETNTRYLHPLILDYADRLTATLPAGLDVVHLVNSGSEANEFALRMARTVTGRRDVAALESGYHGNTSGLVDISPYKFDGPGGSGRPASTHVAPLPDPYRGRHSGDGPRPGTTEGRVQAHPYLADLEAVLTAAADDGHPVGAFFMESAPGSAGQVVPPPGYVSGAFEVARAAGALAIADEVQVGLGRVGSHWWAFEVDGAMPDIVTMGKPLGNGHPLGAVVTTRAVADAFANGMEYFNTFGGNPVSAAVGIAVLDVIEEEGLRARALESGARFVAGLRELAGRHQAIGDVRGLGLFLGVVLVRDRATREPATELAAAVVEGALAHGILLSADGPDHEVLKIKPPLVITEADVDRTIETLDLLLAELA